MYTLITSKWKLEQVTRDRDIHIEVVAPDGAIWTKVERPTAISLMQYNGHLSIVETKDDDEDNAYFFLIDAEALGHYIEPKVETETKVQIVHICGRQELVEPTQANWRECKCKRKVTEEAEATPVDES